MDYASLISTLGFPIVACLAMGYYVKYLTDQHKKEIDDLKQVIEANTIVLTRLYERIIGGDDNG